MTVGDARSFALQRSNRRLAGINHGTDAVGVSWFWVRTSTIVGAASVCDGATVPAPAADCGLQIADPYHCDSAV